MGLEEGNKSTNLMWNGEEEDEMSNKTGQQNWTHTEATMWIIMMTCLKIRQKMQTKALSNRNSQYKWPKKIHLWSDCSFIAYQVFK